MPLTQLSVKNLIPCLVPKIYEIKKTAVFGLVKIN